MKKNHFLLAGLIAIVGITTIVGCSPNEDSQMLKVEDNIIIMEYNEAVSKATLLNKESLELLGASSGSRSDSKDDMVGYLLSLSPEEIEDLYISLDIENQGQKTDELFSMKLDSLMSVAPAEDIAKLYSFMEEYVSSGGHSISMVESGYTTIQSPIVKSMVINSAAIYDNMTTPYTAASLAAVSRASRACVLQLAFDCGGIAIGLCSTAIDFADDNYGFAIVGCVHDAISIISAVRNYHRCERLAGLNHNNYSNDIVREAF